MEKTEKHKRNTGAFKSGSRECYGESKAGYGGRGCLGRSREASAESLPYASTADNEASLFGVNSSPGVSGNLLMRKASEPVFASITGREQTLK